MPVDRSVVIAGMRMREVRDGLRLVRRYSGADDGFDVDAIGEAFHVNAGRALAIVDALVASGLLARDSLELRLTEAGVRLCAKNLLPPLARPKADSLVAGLLARADIVRSSPIYTYEVGLIMVFGSYTDPARLALGDVDVALRLVPHGRFAGDMDAWRLANEERRSSAPHRANAVEWAVWPQEEVRRFLRGRHAHLSLHDLSEIEALGAPMQQIYPPPDATP